MTPTEQWFKNRGSDFCYNSRTFDNNNWVIDIKFYHRITDDLQIIDSVLKFRSIKNNNECYECACVFHIPGPYLTKLAHARWTEIIFNHLQQCETVQSYFAFQKCKTQTRDIMIQLPIVLCDIIAEYGYENELQEVFNLFPKNIFISLSDL